MGAVFSDSPYFSIELFKLIGLSLFFVGLILYPLKHTRFAFLKHSYFRQKCMDGILIFSSLFFFCGLGQQLMEETSTERMGVIQTKAWRAELVVHSRPTNISPKASKKAIRKQNRLERKQLRKQLKNSIKKYKKELSPGAKTLLIIGTVLLGSILSLVLSVLSCSLICSGMDILGFILYGGGNLLIVALAIVAIRRILGKTKKIKEL